MRILCSPNLFSQKICVIASHMSGKAYRGVMFLPDQTVAFGAHACVVLGLAIVVGVHGRGPGTRTQNLRLPMPAPCQLGQTPKMFSGYVFWS